MNKKLLIPLFAVLGVGLVLAVAAGVYYVSILNLTAGVKEAFVVSYSVIGDASTYTDGTCAALTEDKWFTADSSSIPTGGFYPMESRKVCVRIQNLGEVGIPYVIKADVTNDNANNDCAHAFETPYSLTGTASPLDYTYKGVTVQIESDATPVEGCNVEIKVGRGTEEA